MTVIYYTVLYITLQHSITISPSTTVSHTPSLCTTYTTTSDDEDEQELLSITLYHLSPLSHCPPLSTTTLDDEDEQELLSSVFRSLAGRKAYIAPKDLLDWDIVLELMGEVRQRFGEVVKKVVKKKKFYEKNLKKYSL